MKKAPLSIILGLLVALFTLTVVTSYYPSLDDLLIENPYWNGLSEFYKLTDPVRVSNLEGLVPDNENTLFIIGPDTDFQREEAEHVNRFLSEGGRVVLCDDFGTGSQLLAYLGVNIRFDGGLIRDEIFRDSNPVFPRVDAGYYEIDYLVLNYPTFLIGNVSESTVVRSSFFSYSIESMDQFPEKIGIHPIIAELSYSRGELVLISDSSLFINSMIDKGGNKHLLRTLIKGEVLIDEAHRTQSSIGEIKSLLAKTYTLLGFYEVRYSLILIIIFGILRVNLSVDPDYIDPIEEVLQRHPEYDRKQIEWLEEERRKAREKI